MNKQRIIAILIIPICLLVIVMGVYFIYLYYQSMQRDVQREQVVEKIIKALDNYYKDKQLYPGTPYYYDWHYLITYPEFVSYYDFSQFKDPCAPQKKVGELGIVECPGLKVNYRYLGIDCTQEISGCKGYKLTVEFETIGKKEYHSW